MTPCSGNAAAPQCQSDSIKALFVVTGPANPDLLPNVIAPLAALGTVPLRIHATCESGDGSEMTVEMRLSGVPVALARQVEHSLRALVDVRQVFALVEPLA